MIVSVGVRSKLWLWAHPIYFTLSPRIRRRQRPFFSYFFKTLAQENEVSSSPSFLPWLENKAGMKISCVLSIAESASGTGRSLCASEPISAGDCILEVPYSVQLAPDNLPHHIFYSLALRGDDITNVAKLALLILYELKLGQNSTWFPYISRLPPPKDMDSTIFWSDDELQMIRPSTLYHETVKQKIHIKKQFLAIKSAFGMFAEVFEDVTLKDFKYAYSLVTSRAWESSSGVSMIPFADFLNHDCSSEAYLLSNESKKVSEVIADRNYAPGDQVFIKYGKYSNATLLLDFGFTLPCNIYDQVQVELKVPHDDPLSAMKLELLHRHRTPTIKDVNEFSSSENSFTVKEVKSSNGKGRGIPQSLRAFARVLCSNSAQELSDLEIEAEQDDGRLARRPLENKSREVEAHQLISLMMTRLIEEHNASIESLLRPTHGGCMFEKCDPRRRSLALDLLTGEHRVLKSAITWLKNYCTKLLEY